MCMYLSRILLDTSKRKTQIALASPNKIHGAVEEAFSIKQSRNLWRIDTLHGKTYLLLLSSAKPDLSGIAEQFGYQGDCGESKVYDTLLDRIRKGAIWQFRLVANPVHSVKGEKSRGKVIAHISKKYQTEWLNQQAAKKGFQVLPESMCIMKSEWKIFNKRNEKQKVHILEVTYEGKLMVQDVDVFRDTLEKGIGREKAYGMGLLTIAGEEV